MKILIFITIIFLTGCSSFSSDRTRIMELLEDNGCRVTEYVERFEKSVRITCDILEF